VSFGAQVAVPVSVCKNINPTRVTAVSASESSCLFECKGEAQLSIALSQLCNQNMSDASLVSYVPIPLP